MKKKVRFFTWFLSNLSKNQFKWNWNSDYWETYRSFISKFKITVLLFCSPHKCKYNTNIVDTLLTRLLLFVERTNKMPQTIKKMTFIYLLIFSFQWHLFYGWSQLAIKTFHILSHCKNRTSMRDFIKMLFEIRKFNTFLCICANICVDFNEITDAVLLIRLVQLKFEINIVGNNNFAGMKKSWNKIPNKFLSIFENDWIRRSHVNIIELYRQKSVVLFMLLVKKKENIHV